MHHCMDLPKQLVSLHHSMYMLTRLSAAHHYSIVECGDNAGRIQISAARYA